MAEGNGEREEVVLCFLSLLKDIINISFMKPDVGLAAHDIECVS